MSTTTTPGTTPEIVAATAALHAAAQAFAAALRDAYPDQFDGTLAYTVTAYGPNGGAGEEFRYDGRYTHPSG